jgi:hypothetical protein
MARDKSMSSRRTRKVSSSSSHTHPGHYATFHGLHHWHKAMFEELGWMILAKKYGYMDKVYAYKNSVARLKEALEKRMASMKDTDRKKDLSILHQNVMTLMEHAEKDL